MDIRKEECKVMESLSVNPNLNDEDSGEVDPFGFEKSLEESAKQDPNSNGINLGATIGESIGWVLVLVITVAFIWYIVKRKKESKIVVVYQKKNSDSISNKRSSVEELKLPALLQGSMWAPLEPGESKYPEFTLNTDTIVPGFDDGIIDPGKPVWGLNSRTR